jgi:2-oxoacid:acceptor oxidoreductase gamma subunit (pyruvate/2-ketoisovalerate family)
MREFRIHGRGGQGVMTVGQLLAEAFFARGAYVQTFATYGGERRGAPVTAFVRVADRPIARRCDVERPELVMLFEATFLADGSGLAGLGPGATVLVNTPVPPDPPEGLRVATVDALRAARECGLGRIINTAMLGAFCRVSGLLTLDGMEAVLKARLGAEAEANVAAMRRTFAEVRMAGEVVSHA